MELLLLSNSKTPDGGYLAHALKPARSLLRGRKKALFIPYAGVTVSWDEYVDKVREAFTPLGLQIESIHASANAHEALERTEIIIVGGGNTFQLLKCCREQGLLPRIATRVPPLSSQARSTGSSAAEKRFGSILARDDGELSELTAHGAVFLTETVNAKANITAGAFKTYEGSEVEGKIKTIRRS